MPVATSTALLVGGALAGAGASIYGANKAADAQKKAAAASNNLISKQYDQTRADLAPYRTAGSNALSQYSNALGLNGQAGYDSAVANYQESPFLSTLINRTRDSVEASRAARSGLFSGGTAQEIGDRTGQLWLGDWHNYLGNLGNISGQGQNASAQTANFGQNAASQQGNNIMGAGQAQAGGYINTANSVNNFLGQAAGAYGASQGGNPYSQYLNQNARSIFG